MLLLHTVGLSNPIMHYCIVEVLSHWLTSADLILNGLMSVELLFKEWLNDSFLSKPGVHVTNIAGICS